MAAPPRVVPRPRGPHGLTNADDAHALSLVGTTEDELRLIHTDAHIAGIRRNHGEAIDRLGRAGVGAALAACEAVHARKVRNAFVCSRPPGHHARNDGEVVGFCLYNNVAVAARHLQRIFEAQWGVSPLQYLQTRRLLAAKQLLTDTDLRVAQVAHLSGFASVRRFNAAFVGHYQLQPTVLRKAGPQASGLRLQASYRPPYDIAAMLGFLAQRGLDGVEHVDTATASIARTMAVDT
ncbi:MAG: helix-turn-helix domain-containing protein, partial [Proteobacteria bacterium]|nr:helix-turn-helix domain-containing protein [Pseudomonadota bacterium]